MKVPQYLLKSVSTHCIRDSITPQLRRPVHRIPRHWNKFGYLQIRVTLGGIDVRLLKNVSEVLDRKVCDQAQHTLKCGIYRRHSFFFHLNSALLKVSVSSSSDVNSAELSTTEDDLLSSSLFISGSDISASGNTVSSWIILPLLVRRRYKSQSMTIADQK
ncbi:hypothetical protein Tsp_10179 [Trichinella spiralis]|uniref:hypothetical protein n=1 Tax=Trichinella spiralis TaxID=6334 RepID=UPI0001EFDBD0|nr:hypothetical protein Tsp_10179 [Trichinella spiralis]